ncbi:uncharacterized protein FSUBG_1045 [Fusarium subglutinans]|uniref:Uncharacterized protein n=1 Tax=Gibberella subglutinans TaxID=42677 RepID=A0A8H5QBG8_GIBSU|nr:uncharacterized protein FSUBG_1045 [Fusarium subglutinans]KAF5613315.1 hypothetical protein FSUBG_1045 [Fusarium subglutinans]
MTTERQLGKCYQFHFVTTTYNIPSSFITNTGSLLSLFKDKDEYEMEGIDDYTGCVFINYIVSHTYEVDYETAEQDEEIASSDYKTALMAWALGRMYNIYDLVLLARNHVVKLAKLINPVWRLSMTVDTPLAMKHITGIIHRIDDYTDEVLESTTRQQATETLLHVQPPETVGGLWSILQLMQKAQGPALDRGWRMVNQTAPTLVPELTEYLASLQEMAQESEQMYPEDDDVVEYSLTPFNHWIPSAQIKCGKVMRAMVGSNNSSQKIGTRNKEKPAPSDKCIFTISFTYFIRSS